MRNQSSQSGTDPKTAWHAISEVGDTTAMSTHSLIHGAGISLEPAIGKNLSNGGVLDMPCRHLINRRSHLDCSFLPTSSEEPVLPGAFTLCRER